MEQRTIDWFKVRLGHWTGSRIGDLFKKGRAKDAMFGDTALAYIYEVAAEREMNPRILESNELFSEYIEQVSVSTKEMRWGEENEEFAKLQWSKITGIKYNEVGSCAHPVVENFAASPDGLTDDAVLEVKCPKQSTYMQYRHLINDAEGLLKVRPMYYYQMMAEMACTGKQYGYFIAYCPFQIEPIHYVKIERNDAVIAEMIERINAAEKIVNQILNNKAA